MGRIVKNYLYNLIYQLLVILVPLLTAPYLARVLGANGTGQYSYVNSMTCLICTIVMLGIYNYGNRQIAYVRDDTEKLNETFWEICTVRILITIIGTLVYAIVVSIIGKYQFLFLLYYTYLLGYFVDCTWLFVGLEDMKWAVLKNILIKLIAVIGIFTFVKGEADVSKYVFIQGSSILIGNLFAYTQIGKYISYSKVTFSHLKKHIIGSIFLFLPSVASTLYLQCDKIMIEMFTGECSQVSFYDYSEKIVTIPLSFITVLSTVMMPRIANEFKKGNRKEISKLLNLAAQISMFMAFPMTIGLMSVANKLVPWYLGNGFSPTIIAIICISPIIITNTLSGISGNQYFTATNQMFVLLKAQITAAIGNIILNALLIPVLGFLGAAFATLVSSILCASIQYFNLLKEIKLPGLFKVGLKYLIVSLIMGVVVIISTKSWKATPVTSLTQVLIGISVYLIIMFITKDKVLLYILDFIRRKMLKRKEIEKVKRQL